MEAFEKKVSILLILIGALLSFLALGALISYEYENRISDKSIERAESFVEDVKVYDLTKKESILPEDEMDIGAMEEINPDVVGFLKVQGNGFPVVKSEDNAKYMKLSWDNKKTACGSIFMDNYCDLSGKNIVLYGHHMKSGRMFGSLSKYLTASYRNENPGFKWITKDYVDTFEIVAVIKDNAQNLEKLLDMDLKADLESLSEKAKKTNTCYKELNSGKTYMSLVTCEYSNKDGRLIVIGERVSHLERH